MIRSTGTRFGAQLVRSWSREFTAGPGRTLLVLGNPADPGSPQAAWSKNAVGLRSSQLVHEDRSWSRVSKAGPGSPELVSEVRTLV